MLSYSRIIVPIDFSPGSEAAARFAQAMAAYFHSKVLIVHVEGDPRWLEVKSPAHLRSAQLTTRSG